MKTEKEVEKLYGLAGVEPVYPYTKCYPEFTSEKQIYLIKWLSDKADYIDIHYDRYKGLFNIQTGMGGLCVCSEFEQALASRVNIIWQDLTEEEKQQIKNILQE